MRILRFFFILCLLMLVYPVLYAQNIDYLEKAREFLSVGDCERAEYAYRDYKKVNLKGNAEIEAAIRKCKENKMTSIENQVGKQNRLEPLRASAEVIGHNRCHGCDNGIIQVKATGGDGSYFYYLKYNGEEYWHGNLSTFYDLEAGVYSVRVVSGTETVICENLRVTEPLNTPQKVYSYEVLPYNIEGNYSWGEAKDVCKKLLAYGKKDWYLPSINELEILSKENAIPQLRFWSSTEYSSSEAYSFENFRLSSEHRRLRSKYFTAAVRCIRKY